MIKTLIVFSLLFFSSSFANDIGSETSLEIPRYVSLKSNESNLRVGPSKNYPILLKYILNNFPLKIVEEYKDWRKVIDFKKNEGWIHKSLVKGERYGIIISNKNVKVLNSLNGKFIGEIANGEIVKLSRCNLKSCFVKKNNYKGWVERSSLWGLNEYENINYSFFHFFYDYYYKSLNIFEVLVKKYLLNN